MLTSQDGIEAARSAITWQARLPAAREQPFTKSERTPRHTHTTKNETRWFLTIAELSKNKLIILNRGTTGSQESTKNCTKTFIWWQVQLLRTNMPRAQRRLFRRTETRADCSLCDLAQHVTWNTTSCTDRHRTLRGSISLKTATKSWRQTSEHPHNAISASRQSPQTEGNALVRGATTQRNWSNRNSYFSQNASEKTKRRFRLHALCTPCGVSRVVCGVHLRLLCAVGHAATFAVNAALVASQWQRESTIVYEMQPTKESRDSGPYRGYMTPGARNNFGAPWEQIYCIEESTCDIVGTFRRRGYCAPFGTLLPPLKLINTVPRVGCVRQSCGVGHFWWSRVPKNTMNQSRNSLSDSDSPIDSFFTLHCQDRNSCWNGTLSFETFIETENSCCVPRFPLIASCFADSHSHSQTSFTLR